MHSLPCFDGCYPVRTLYTDNNDCLLRGWQDADGQKALLQDYLRISLKRVIYAKETHSGSVLAVSSETGEHLAVRAETYAAGRSGGYDALVTDAAGILLGVQTADCPPLFLYDPEKHVAALAHCGWKGILNGIVANTVDVMIGHFGADPGHMIAGFGPCICGNCYEVREDLHEEFSRRFSLDAVREFFRPQPNEKYLLDLKGAIRFELRRTGFRPEEIRDIGICSYESEAYASYRRNGPANLTRSTLSGIVLL